MKVFLTLVCLIGVSQACPLGAPLVPREALRDLQIIQRDISLTRDKFDLKMADWAKKYNLEDQYNAYKHLMEQQKLAAEHELDEAVQRLPNLIAQLREIERDNNLTRALAFQHEKAVIDRLPTKQQELLKAAARIYAPAYQQQQQRRPCGPGPFRPGPYGLGLFLPGPSGHGEFWQEIFGPRPLGPNWGFHHPSPFGPSRNGYGLRPPPYGWVL